MQRLSSVIRQQKPRALAQGAWCCPGSLMSSHLLRMPPVSTRGCGVARTARLLYINVSRSGIRRDAAGAGYILYSKRDITHLKVARDAKLVQTRFGALLESTPDATLIVNAMGRIVLANSQAARAFAYEPRELIGEPVEVLLPERFRSAHVGHRLVFSQQPRMRAMGRGLELFGRRSDGYEFPVEISLSPLATDEGMMVMSAVRDITDRKKAEQKFRGLLESAPDAMVIVGARRPHRTGQLPAGAAVRSIRARSCWASRWISSCRRAIEPTTHSIARVSSVSRDRVRWGPVSNSTVSAGMAANSHWKSA